jgi:hypothetical protein
MQLCAAFNIHDASTTMIFHVEAVRCIVARNGESKWKSRFNAQSLEKWQALCKWCHAEAILPPRRDQAKLREASRQFVAGAKRKKQLQSRRGGFVRQLTDSG